MPKAHDGEIESIRRALVGLRRIFQRKDLVGLWESAFGRHSMMDYAELKLLDAVRVASDGGATVGEISRLLGVDPSRASRQVTSAVARGLLARRAAPDDGRKVVLEVTDKGARLQQRGSELTRARIELAVRRWPASRRARFAKELSLFVAGMISR
jgi:DNA-binding MarR family transcriptional regulator